MEHTQNKKITKFPLPSVIDIRHGTCLISMLLAWLYSRPVLYNAICELKVVSAALPEVSLLRFVKSSGYSPRRSIDIIAPGTELY